MKAPRNLPASAKSPFADDRVTLLGHLCDDHRFSTQPGVSGAPLVLCAEDDEDILSLVALRLRLRGYEVVTATDGPSALAAARERVPAVAVLDVMMPRMTGLEVVEAMRGENALREVKVILLSARAQDSDQERGMAAGADLYLMKPFKFNELEEAVAGLLERRD